MCIRDSANSVWVLVDTRTGRPVKVPQEFADTYGLEPQLEICLLYTSMEAYVSLMKLENVRILKEMRNSVNRKVNLSLIHI